MSRIQNSLCTIILLMLISGCGRVMESNQYLAEVAQDKDYVKVYEDSIFRLQCSYRPQEFLAVSEMKGRSGSQGMTEQDFRQQLKTFENARYFDVVIGLRDRGNIMTRNVRSQGEYAELVGYLNYGIGDDLYVLAGNDTVKALTYNFLNNYGMGPDVRILFAFPKRITDSNAGTLRVIYNDRALGITDRVEFEYSIPDLTKKQPEIKFSNLN